jgi:hypothetical protein
MNAEHDEHELIFSSTSSWMTCIQHRGWRMRPSSRHFDRTCMRFFHSLFIQLNTNHVHSLFNQSLHFSASVHDHRDDTMLTDERAPSLIQFHRSSIRSRRSARSIGLIRTHVNAHIDIHVNNIIIPPWYTPPTSTPMHLLRCVLSFIHPHSFMCVAWMMLSCPCPCPCCHVHVEPMCFWCREYGLRMNGVMCWCMVITNTHLIHAHSVVTWPRLHDKCNGFVHYIIIRVHSPVVKAVD